MSSILGFASTFKRCPTHFVWEDCDLLAWARHTLYPQYVLKTFGVDRRNEPTMNDQSDIVVLVHGFGAKRAVMLPLGNRLRSFGFRVVHWNYVSLFDSIESHASRFNFFLHEQLCKESCFHIVAHSMGSIVTRAALNHSRLPNLGRIVFLAPPNGGSPIARLASMVVGRFVTPTRELSDQPSSYVNRLQTISDFDIGVIAAKYDLLVPARNTHLPNERQHLTVWGTHNSLLLSRTACEKTAMFLRTGEFEATVSTPPTRTC